MSASGQKSLIGPFDVFEDRFKPVQRLIDDLRRVGHRGIQAAAGQRDNTVCHIGRAHALHGILADIHHILVLEQTDGGLCKRHGREIETHCARTLEMYDGTLIIGYERQAVLLEQALEAVAQAVAHFTRDLTGVRALNLADGRVTGEAGQRIGRQRAADIGPVFARGKTRRHEFATARSMAGAHLPPAYVYAVETAIQMTLTELNENLREIYIEAYTQKEASDYIFRETAKELYQIFGSYQPELTAQDFFFMELGSAGIMRAYMAHPCDEELTLEKKLQMFLTMSLRSYHVPEDEIQKIIAFIGGMDIRTVSERVMHELFKALAMRFEFTL